MAELQIITDANHSKYENGDVLCAYNDRKIWWRHANGICWQNGAFNSEGRRKSGTLLETYLTAIHRYKIEQISMTQVQVIILATGEVKEICGATANEFGHVFNREFIDRRLKKTNHRIFGTRKRSYWYGGNGSRDSVVIESLWQEIEGRTPLRKASHSRWIATDWELKRDLFLRVDDFSEDTMADYQTALEEETGELEPHSELPVKRIVKARKHCLDWEEINDLAPHLADIRNRQKPVDLREMKQFNRALLRIKAANG